jgi:hypothetical protein
LKKDNFLIEKWRIEAENIKMSIEKAFGMKASAGI